MSSIFWDNLTCYFGQYFNFLVWCCLMITLFVFKSRTFLIFCLKDLLLRNFWFLSFVPHLIKLFTFKAHMLLLEIIQLYRYIGIICGCFVTITLWCSFHIFSIALTIRNYFLVELWGQPNNCIDNKKLIFTRIMRSTQ